MTDYAFAHSDFARLGRTLTEADAVQVLRPKVDRLIALINGLPQARKLNDMRAVWNLGTRHGDFFRTRVYAGVDYIYGSAGHWYIYHRGGRWEPQFNIGMYGVPGHGYIRVGLGFNTTMQSRDPDRETGVARIRALFSAFHQLAGGELGGRLKELADRPGTIIEQVSDLPAPEIQKGANAIDWLASVAPQDFPRWFFIGRALFVSAEMDASVLASWKRVGAVVDQEFATLTPVWRSVWAAA